MHFAEDFSPSTEPRTYPQRLGHATPGWVRPSSFFHIRLRCSPQNRRALIHAPTATVLLAAARHYHQRGRWNCRIFLLMPDHLHALLAFPSDSRMSRTIGEWKRYMAQTAGIAWQTNYFDHRIRSGAELREKFSYILRNPVVKRLCSHDEAWAWRWPEVDPAVKL